MKQLLLTLFLICPIIGFSQINYFNSSKSSDRKTQDRITHAKQLNDNRRMAFGVPRSGRRLITFNKFMRQHKKKFKG